MVMPAGKCRPCNIVYEWVGKPRVKNAWCLVCRFRLFRTTHLSHSPKKVCPEYMKPHEENAGMYERQALNLPEADDGR